MNPTDNLGIWLVILTVATALTGWNITRLRAVRPVLDGLVAVLGAGAILAVVIGASLVVTEVTECTFAASTLSCGRQDILLVALTDLAASAAMITLWLRSDACRAPRRLVSRAAR
ncbi:MAG: hypothetical protein ABI867_24910 [Kofleriaceae bacterium]